MQCQGPGGCQAPTHPNPRETPSLRAICMEAPAGPVSAGRDGMMVENTAAHRSVFDLPKLCKVVLEVLISQLSLRRVKWCVQYKAAGSEANAGRSKREQRTVPPTNIFFVSCPVPPCSLGTPALTSTGVPLITCSRCCATTSRQRLVPIRGTTHMGWLCVPGMRAGTGAGTGSRVQTNLEKR
jgi:hypothetical protein